MGLRGVEREAGAEAAAVARRERQRSALAARDGLHQRQPEAEAFACQAAVVAAVERLGEHGQVRGRQVGAGVGDLDPRPALVRAHVDGDLTAVDPGGLPTGDGDAVTPPTATVEFEDQAQVADAGAVAVRIVIRDDEEQPETLVVPATALLATPDGGYAVEVWDGASATRTPVTIGLVADARAQVLASGADAGGDGRVLAPGDLVVLAR